MAFKMRGWSAFKQDKETSSKGDSEIDLLRQQLNTLKENPDYDLDAADKILSQLRILRKEGKSGTGDVSLKNNPNVSGLGTKIGDL